MSEAARIATSGRHLRRLLSSVIFGLLLLMSCGEADPQERATPPQQAPSEQLDCAALWTEIRESSVRAGLADGEARRLADQARVECEGVAEVEPPPVTSEPCGKTDSGFTPPDGGYVSVFFTCEADAGAIGSDQHTVYARQREVPSSATSDFESRVAYAVKSYLLGPTDSEVGEGLFSSAPQGLADVHTVTARGGEITVDIDPSASGALGNLATTAASEAFLLELGKTVFQFEDASALSLTLGGDCEALWRFMERGCQRLTPQAGGAG